MKKSTNQEIRKKRAKKNKLKTWQVVLIAVLLIILLSVGAFAVYFSVYKPQVSTSKLPFDPNTESDLPKTGQDGNQPGDDVPTPPKSDVARKDGFFNFLLLGCDKGGLNTDVIIVASFDTENGKIAMLQIPRDTYVEPSYGHRKLNSVYAKGYTTARTSLNSLKRAAGQSPDSKKLDQLCQDAAIDITPEVLKKYLDGAVKQQELCHQYGIQYVSDVLKDTFGIIIDFHAMVDLQGFRNIVDAIGGVEVTVQEDMNYDDPYQNLHIHLKAGTQTLDGDKAEQFIRFRYGYVGADISRIEAQKIFMSALIDKLMSMSTLPKIPELVEQLTQYVTTDLSMSDLIFFAKEALIGTDLDAISMMTLPGVATNQLGGSYFSIAKAASVNMVNDYFNVFNRSITQEMVQAKELVESSAEQPDVSTAKEIEATPPELDFLRPRRNSATTEEGKTDAPLADQTDSGDAGSDSTHFSVAPGPDSNGSDLSASPVEPPDSPKENYHESESEGLNHGDAPADGPSNDPAADPSDLTIYGANGDAVKPAA